MTTAVIESARTYELVRINPHARRLTFELRLLGTKHCLRRKLRVIKNKLEQQHLRRFGIQELHFPNRSTHRLIIETTKPAHGRHDVNSVCDRLYEQLDNVILTTVEDVDQHLAAKDNSINTADSPVIAPRNANGSRRHDRKQKRTERTQLRRANKKFQRNRIAITRAFADADLPPVVI